MSIFKNLNSALPKLPIGCKVTYFASYGFTYSGWIVSEVKDGNQDMIYASGDGHKLLSIDPKHTPSVSNKFGIGVYYNDNLEVISESEVLQVKSQLATDIKIREAKAKEQAIKDEQTRQELIEKYDYLTVLDSGNKYNANEIKKNLVALLKNKFSTTKFSVRKDGYLSYIISWDSELTTEEVDDAVKIFIGYKFDYSGDFYDSNPSIFNNLFGYLKFISTYKK